MSDNKFALYVLLAGIQIGFMLAWGLFVWVGAIPSPVSHLHH
jgi:hypothetical protein